MRDIDRAGFSRFGVGVEGFVMDDISLRFAIQTVSEANQREHWTVKRRRKKLKQRDFSLIWKSWRKFHPKETPKCIIFTRHSCHTMDADNLAGAFKHVQDALAKELGIDDGDMNWKYEQKRIGTKEQYFTVRWE